MKIIHIRKKDKVKKFERITEGNIINLDGDRWEVLAVNCSSSYAPTMVLRKKMATAKCIMIVRVDINQGGPHFTFEKINGINILKWTDAFGFSGLEFTGSVFGTLQETIETGYHPVVIGDMFQHSAGGRGIHRYVVKFIADDGSLVAWDEERHKSVFVNRNDRDQLRAYGMELR